MTEVLLYHHVQGLTDGTPPGLVNYKVLTPGQSLVAAGS